MRRTKIVCTMGPNTNSRDLMKKLIETGMDVARFNFSHGDHEEQKMRMDMLKELRKELKTPVAILLDTKGPEIRTGVLKDGKKVNLVTGQTFTLTTVQETGDENHCSVSYTGLTDDIKEGDTILCLPLFWRNLGALHRFVPRSGDGWAIAKAPEHRAL